MIGQRRRKIARTLTIATGIAAVAAMGGIGPSTFGIISPAGAIIGRPLTPMSYAGVARRTTFRAGAYGAAAYAGAATAAAATSATAAPPAAATPTTTVIYAAPPGNCVKTVEANGSTTYRCP